MIMADRGGKGVNNRVRCERDAIIFRVLARREMSFKVVLCVAVLSLWLSCALCGYQYEVRGLDPSRKARYHPGKDFTCLDGSDTVAFSMGEWDFKC